MGTTTGGISLFLYCLMYIGASAPLLRWLGQGLSARFMCAHLLSPFSFVSLYPCWEWDTGVLCLPLFYHTWRVVSECAWGWGVGSCMTCFLAGDIPFPLRWNHHWIDSLPTAPHFYAAFLLRFHTDLPFYDWFVAHFSRHLLNCLAKNNIPRSLFFFLPSAWSDEAATFSILALFKGTVAQDFLPRFFSWIYSIWAPDFDANRIFFSFSRSYLNISMNPRCRLLRGFKFFLYRIPKLMVKFNRY